LGQSRQDAISHGLFVGTVGAGSLDFCAWLQYQELREIEDAAIIN